MFTGNLDDGAAGLLVVKKRGGVAVVQDPDSALFPGMPQSALEYVDVDYCLPLSDIPPLLTTLAREPAKVRAGPVSKEVEVESKIAEFDMSTIENDKEKIGTPSVFSCPECQGTLWELRDGTQPGSGVEWDTPFLLRAWMQSKPRCWRLRSGLRSVPWRKEQILSADWPTRRTNATIK